MLRAAAASSRKMLVRGVQVRGMATEKEIAMRISATKNIRKITSSMKMVSASKLRGDQQRLEAAKAFGAWTSTLGTETTSFEELLGKPSLEENVSSEKKNVVIALTSDKGLCGGVNSAIARGVRGLVSKSQGADISVCVVGEKGRSQLSRMVGSAMHTSYADVAAPISFSFAVELAGKILSQFEAATVHVAYNKFKSAIAYVPSLATLAPFAPDGEKETLAAFEYEQPEAKESVLQNLFEYYVATELYYGLIEAATSEQSSRM